MNLRKSLIAALGIAAISAPLVAQAGEMRNREARQEKRINNQRREYLESGNGRLTNEQVYRLNREENRLSGRIYAEKHNTIKPPR